MPLHFNHGVIATKTFTSQANRGHEFYNSRTVIGLLPLCSHYYLTLTTLFLWCGLLTPALGTEHRTVTSRAGSPVAEHWGQAVSRGHQAEKRKVKQVAVCSDCSHLYAEGRQSPRRAVTTTVCAWDLCKHPRIQCAELKSCTECLQTSEDTVRGDHSHLCGEGMQVPVHRGAQNKARKDAKRSKYQNSYGRSLLCFLRRTEGSPGRPLP